MLGGAWFTAFAASLLFGGWVYNKLMRSTANSKSALTAAAIAGLLFFLVVGVLLSYLINRFN